MGVEQPDFHTSILPYVETVVTLALTLRVPEEHQEWLIAELAEWGLDAFEPDEKTLKAYGPAAAWSDTAREHVEGWLAARGLPTAIEERAIEPEDWNARWEASIRPVAVGSFVIAPTWAAPGPEHAGRTLLRIDPKMSFGTGYHPSTRLALSFLPALVRGGERVLDVGTGTGVLALAALKLGAATAVGVDIDPWSVANARENAALNGLSDRFEAREGSTEDVPERGFSLVCANIIRTVLVALLPDLAARLAPDGALVLAGLLTKERGAMLDAAALHSLMLVTEASEGEWWACALSREVRRTGDEGQKRA